MQNEHVVYKDGAVIFEDGSISKEICVIESGKVEVGLRIRGTKIPLAVLGKGDFLGEMAVLTDVRRSATAVARGEVSPRPLRLGEIMPDRQVALELMQILANRLRITTAKLRDVATSVADLLSA